MVKIDYHLTSYEDFFRHLSKCLKLKITDNTISFTPDKGSGYIKFISLPNGSELLLFDFTCNNSISFHLRKSKNEFFVLRLDEAVDLAGMVRSSVLFAKTSQEWHYMVSKNTRLRHLHFVMSKQWLEDYFENEAAGETLLQYIILKSPLLLYELMDTEYKQLMHEIMHLPHEKEFEQLLINNRASLIIERFYTRLFRRIENENAALKISPAEFKKIKQVEHELLKDFSQQPPAIAQLARIATMSPSKLKVLFKKVFGQPVNQYYQKHRMNKAKAMLLSKKYSLREIAMILGFSSISSFNKAFVKAFQQSPSEITNFLNKQLVD